MAWKNGILGLIMLLAVGCSSSATPVSLQNSASPTPILVFGDSLSAGYKLEPDQGWVYLMEQKMHQEGWLVEHQSIANESISGETTSGGLARFEDALSTHTPDVVILELGANDALRRQSMSEMQQNLSTMITQAQAAGAQVFLVGVDLPSKFFFVNTDHFTDAYIALAKEHDVVLIPNLLDGVNSDNSLMLSDGLHPNDKGQPVIVDNVWPHLQEHIL